MEKSHPDKELCMAKNKALGSSSRVRRGKRDILSHFYKGPKEAKSFDERGKG